MSKADAATCVCSWRSHVHAVELSRRDDLVSIGYVLVYFLKGSLPWQGLQAESHEDKYQRILEKKQSTSLEDLCEDLPGRCHVFVCVCCRCLTMNDN